MDALVADVSVAEVPEPVPVVMDQVRVVRLFPGRAEPQVEVQVSRRLLRRFRADAPPRFAAVAFRDEQLAVLTRLDGGDLGGPARARALLGAVLDDPLIPGGRLDTPAAL